MVRVTLDIFSGRPNPVWELDDDAAADLLRQVEEARDIVGGINTGSGRLGFRGMLLESDDDGRALRDRELPRQLRISGDHPHGVELALRLLDALGPPRAVAAPRAEGIDLAPIQELDLRRLIEEDAAGSTGRGEPRGGVEGRSDSTVSAAALNPAPVIGTDASSWTTQAQGSCQIEVAAFNPNFWNVSPVQANNNCYNYATNRRTDTFAQPGKAAGQQATQMKCANVSTGAQADGAYLVPSCVPSGQEPRWYMAMVVWPGVDYHWYRLQAEGYWGHKPGQTAARNYDNSNVVITNPETANRGGYRNFCGYFFARSGMGIR
ncbi:MAG TPA: hypothetical protein VF092_29625 [Longimicrobium sp.]